jgi:protein SCO1
MKAALGLGLLLAWATAATAASALPRLGPAPNFALTTQQNDRLWLTQLRGRVVVLTFTCTTCEACAGFLAGLADLARALGPSAGRQVFFVAVTVDPERDTPEVLRAFARRERLDPPAWLLLTGTPAEVEAVERRYTAPARREAGRWVLECRALLIDGDGVLRVGRGPSNVGRLREDLDGLLAEAGGS